MGRERGLKLRKWKVFPSPSTHIRLRFTRPFRVEIILIHGNSPQRASINLPLPWRSIHVIFHEKAYLENSCLLLKKMLEEPFIKKEMDVRKPRSTRRKLLDADI